MHSYPDPAGRTLEKRVTTIARVARCKEHRRTASFLKRGSQATHRNVTDPQVLTPRPASINPQLATLNRRHANPQNSHSLQIKEREL